MDFDRLPSRPVVKSATSADAEFRRWLYENHFNKLWDGDGTAWDLDIQTEVRPDHHDPLKSLWVARFSMSADLTVDEFLKTGILDPAADERLISLIGSRTVPLRMKPMVYEAVGEQSARDMMAKVLPDLRKTMETSKLRDIKRGLIGRWVDEECQFGVGGGLGRA